MAYGIRVKTKASALTATPLHNNTNGDGPVNIAEFLVEVPEGSDPVYIGGPDVSGDTNGHTVCPKEIKSFQAPDSRGTQDAWDMRCIFYVGGPFKLGCVRQEDFND